MKDVEATVKAFVAWADAEHPEVAADPGIARGVLMLAGSKLVTMEHVTECVDLATEAGNDADTLAAIAEQGELLIEFQFRGRKKSPKARPRMVSFAKRTTGEQAAVDEDHAETPREPDDEPDDSDDEPDDERDDDEPAAPARTRPVVLLASAGVLVVALIAGTGWYLRAMGKSPSAAREATPAAPPARAAPTPAPPRPPLAHLGLERPLPAGWVKDATSDNAIEGVKTSVLIRGGAHEAIVGTTPLPPTIANNLPLSDELHLRLVHFLEYEVARKTQQAGIYRRGGCEITVGALYGHRTAVCSGTALGLHATQAIHTYVRLEDKRAVVGVFVAANDAVDEARTESDRVFAGLR